MQPRNPAPTSITIKVNSYLTLALIGQLLTERHPVKLSQLVIEEVLLSHIALTGSHTCRP
jgi:hypothetical protein